jgi:hypothetical protein
VSIWTDFGFSESPYAIAPVPPNAEGDRLLVGREDELSQLTTQIESLDTHSTLEGDNGAGKTSLVAVAGYRLMSKSLTSGGRSPLFVPLATPMQLDAADTIESFERDVYFKVARGFIDNADQIRQAGLDLPNVEDVKRWLDSPVFRSGQGGVGLVSAGMGSEPNTSAGFEEAGFRSAVRSWLESTFRSDAAGGFVSTLDNLELLETSQHARQMLEAARDSVFALPGLKWVLCGARGIVRSAASSPRLQGVLAEPLEVGPLPDEIIPEVVARRVEYFSASPDAYVPVDGRGFDHIYRIMHGNLRNALKHSQDYAVWLSTQGTLPSSGDEKLALLEVWIAELAERYEHDTSGVTKRDWEVFDGIVSRGGSCSPGDYEEFGFASNPAMRPHVKQLEDANLVISTIDETDQRRRTILLTPRGWLVNYKRSGYVT